MKQIAILGSTGSIGTQTLDVVRQHPNEFSVYALSAHRNVTLLIQQAIEFNPAVVCIADDTFYQPLCDALSDLPIKVMAGEKAIAEMVTMPAIDVVVAAMVGYAGLYPTIEAIKAKKTIALANKETLVVAGEIICRLAKRHNVSILPVDSEHSAIFQCLAGEINNPIEKIILTASGGPFRKHSLEELKYVTKQDALKHPNWEMGAKITIDSASMMNKGFEVIEAKWLFDLKIDQIDVLVHPQSIIHSMVQFKDGSVKAQLGLPDMRLPIAYALSYPNRLDNNYERLDFLKFNQLNFERPDIERFRNLDFAFQAMKQGGNMPCILNAANEIAVYGFLHDKISFLGMSDLIEWAMTNTDFITNPTYEDYVATDSLVRKITSEKIGL